MNNYPRPWVEDLSHYICDATTSALKRPDVLRLTNCRQTRWRNGNSMPNRYGKLSVKNWVSFIIQTWILILKLPAI